MIYYILGILAVIAIHLVTFLKCYENDIKINYFHMVLSVIYSGYVVYLIEFFHDNVIENGIGLMKIVIMFAPIGLFLPIIYIRFKYLLLNIVYGGVMSFLIILLQLIDCGKVNIINVLFAVFGVLIGFLFSMIINEIIPEFRKHCIIKKKKKRIIYLSFEAELFVITVFVLFFAVAGIEKVSGRNFEDELKGIATNESVDKYKNIYYADKDKYERYNRYEKLNPDMNLEEVVWRVDANLDQEFYDESYTKNADKDGSEPLLINKYNKVSTDYEPDELVQIEGNYVATPETVEAYQNLTKDLEDLDMKIYIVSSYRDIAYQQRLYDYYLKSDSKEEVDTYSSRPGYSEHHTGRALDISQVAENLNAFEGSDEAKWVYENAYKYGFIVRYKAEQTDVTGYIFEPWHITYVGMDIANTMHDEGIETLEEYVVKYVDHHK